MSDAIKHECGVAIVRLKKPLAHYREKHGSILWGLKKLYLLMEKQRNRGQDGAGLSVWKSDVAHGAAYCFRHRESGATCLDRLWKHVNEEHARVIRDVKGAATDDRVLKQAYPFLGESYLGHLRYGTHGGVSVENCHPFVRASNWPSRYLTVSGNFNLTNHDEIFDMLVALGQHPIGSADTSTVMEKIGHFLDVANDAILRRLNGSLTGAALQEKLYDDLDIARVLRRAAHSWDGGYMMTGIVGHGVTFALRDPNGIRPGFWYEDDEVVAVASERVALETVFALQPDQVREITPGRAIIVDRRANVVEAEILPPAERRSCTFERIYFSRGNDAAIYKERKALGRELVPKLLTAVGDDLSSTVISYIPNTAETAYYGLAEGLEDHLAVWKQREILKLQESGSLTPDRLSALLAVRPWQEKAALKDAKLRTFISSDDDRGELVSHAYDITRGILRPGIDTLAVIDDSIVRGTTLRQSILRMLGRLQPKRIVVLSSAPQIRYPDCYGIDMAELGKFVAFEAAVSLLRERGMERLLDEVLRACKASAVPGHPPTRENHVKKIYEPFTDEEVSERIARLVSPADPDWRIPVTVLFQSIGGLRAAMPAHTGDWYFSGDYPTPGGFRVCNLAFVHYMERRSGRAYEARA